MSQSHHIQAGIKKSASETTYQIVPQIDDPQTPWMGTRPEAEDTVKYLADKAPASDTFTVINGKPNPALQPYDLTRCVERPPEPSEPQTP
jgi:hypothetical protein